MIITFYTTLLHNYTEHHIIFYLNTFLTWIVYWLQKKYFLTGVNISAL